MKKVNKIKAWVENHDVEIVVGVLSAASGCVGFKLGKAVTMHKANKGLEDVAHKLLREGMLAYDNWLRNNMPDARALVEEFADKNPDSTICTSKYNINLFTGEFSRYI